MKLPRENLLTELNLVRPAIGAVGAVTELSHVWFGDGELHAYNGGLGICINSEAGLRGGLPGGMLISLLKSSTLKEVEFKQERDSLTAKLGRASLKLATLDLDRCIWPFDEESVPPVQFKLTEEFLEALKRVAIIRASSPTNVVHHGVVVEPADGSLGLFTTDTQTLTTIAVEMKVPKNMKRAILPHAFVDALLLLCPAGSMLGIAETYLVASSKGAEVYSNALDVSGASNLPRVIEKLVPKKLTAATVPATLKAALERAEIISGSKDSQVTLSADGNELELAASYPMGSIEEAFELDKPQKAASGSFAIRDLLRALGSTEAMALTESVAIFTGNGGLLYLAAMRPAEKKRDQKPRGKRGQDSDDA